MNTNNEQVRVRFAPSPTGYLHIGNLRTALFNWLFARHHKGTFLVRIEDTDRERSKQEYTDSILASLRWVDIQADEPIVTQSERTKEYEAVVAKLLVQDSVYKCYCTVDDVKDRAGDDLFAKYDGTCRTAADQPSKPYVIRFKLPDIQNISFDDMIRGRVTFDRDQLDDFIIVRSDGSPTYNFVVVVDDAYMRISHIIRGEDHISNTPKQLLLYQACGYTIPKFAHIPLILGPSGDRLSKRDGATSVPAYKEIGYLPDAFINYLVRLGWAHGDQEIFSRQELIDYFTLDAVGKKGSIFDADKLNWVNGVYIRDGSDEFLLAYIQKELDSEFTEHFLDWSAEQVSHALHIYKQRVHTIRELIDEIVLLYYGPKNYNETDITKWTNKDTKELLDQLIATLEIIDLFSPEIIAQRVKELAKQLGVKFVQLAQPIRIAMIGKSAGPGIFELLALVGKKNAVDRVVQLRNVL